MEGAGDEDVITRLHQRTVPDGYTWEQGLLIFTYKLISSQIILVFMHVLVGKSESDVEMLKSIISQLDYQYLILEWEKKGVQFRSHVYVPEVHPLTGVQFHEREDETHVFKVCSISS